MQNRCKELALFDLDNTLLNADSDYRWGEFLVKKGLVDETQFRQKNQDFYEQYIAGTLDAVVYNEFVANFLKQHSLDQLYTWRGEYIAQDIVPNIRPKAVQAIANHRARGHDVLVVSATNDFVVTAIANEFGILPESVLATKLEVTQGGYTGRVADRPNFQDGKIYHLEQWLAKQAQKGVTYNKTYAYSDSKNDLPLLSWADVAICVTPDAVLHAHALAHSWAVEDWSIWFWVKQKIRQRQMLMTVDDSIY